MLDKIIEELEQLQTEYEEHANEYMDDESWAKAKAYENAIRIVKKHENDFKTEKILDTTQLKPGIIPL